VRTFDINPAWFSSSEKEDNGDDDSQNLKIITKRLKKGKIVDLDPAEYNFDPDRRDSNEQLTPMIDDIHRSTSVFKESIYLSYLNSQIGELKNQRKIFSKLIEKEKANRVYLMLNLKGIV
jgi:hypothetical protein